MPTGGVKPQDVGTRQAQVRCMAEPLPLILAPRPVKHTCLAQAQQGKGAHELRQRESWLDCPAYSQACTEQA